MKICDRCREEKPLDGFYSRDVEKVHVYCKQCLREKRQLLYFRKSTARPRTLEKALEWKALVERDIRFRGIALREAAARDQIVEEIRRRLSEGRSDETL